jgi:hypothetical protein
MSDFSLTLVLQNQDKQNHQWHGKSTNKIWLVFNVFGHHGVG